LALVQAEMGNAVPPLAAVFCRLFLLQGVAHHFGGDANKSKEDLDWAFALCSSLRTVSSIESVTSLCDTMVGISESQAISALRRSEGNLNQAAELIIKDKADALEQEERRNMQRKLGLCQNNMDYVDLDILPKLRSVLGLRETKVAAGLLRLADNDLGKAIDIYQNERQNNMKVLQRMSDLDCRQGRTKHSRENHGDAIMVDQVALATLESMGVDESNAKKALAASQNNVDIALLWLTRKDDDESHVANDDETLDVAEEDDEIMDGEQAKEEAASNPSSRDESRMDQQDNHTQSIQEQESEKAEELLRRELGAVLQERDLEKEYLGSTLDEEWGFLVKFRAK
jgi:hypothetical protein